VGRGALRHATIGLRDALTTQEDVAFGLRQLTDVAIKALSPGINDPTTAVHALGHSAALLCGLARGQLGPRRLADADGRVRVELRRALLDDLVRLAVDQPRRYGASDPDVLARLLALLADLAWAADPVQAEPCVRRELRCLGGSGRRSGHGAGSNR